MKEKSSCSWEVRGSLLGSDRSSGSLSCVFHVSFMCLSRIKDGVSQRSLSSLFFSTLRIIHQNVGAENTLSCLNDPILMSGPSSPQSAAPSPGSGSRAIRSRVAAAASLSPPTHAQLWPGPALPPPLRILIARTQLHTTTHFWILLSIVDRPTFILNSKALFKVFTQFMYYSSNEQFYALCMKSHLVMKASTMKLLWSGWTC